MSEDFDLPLDDNIGLGSEDKAKVTSNQIPWFKGEKGRTDRIALVYFNSVEIVTLTKALKQRPDLTSDQKRALVAKVRSQVAERLSKEPDQLDPADLLDISEARLKKVTASFKQGLGFFTWPKGLNSDEEKIWRKVGEPKDYLCTVVVQYPTDREGEVDTEAIPRGCKFLPWRFTSAIYDVIYKINKGLQEGQSSVSKVDLYVSCSDTNYQKLSITQAGPSLYLRDEKLKKYVLERAYPLYSKLSPFREITTDELREKLGMAPSVATAAVGSDFDSADILANV
jgi:hypothetical protein